MRKILVLILLGCFGVAMLPASSAYANVGRHHHHHHPHNGKRHHRPV